MKAKSFSIILLISLLITVLLPFSASSYVPLSENRVKALNPNLEEDTEFETWLNEDDVWGVVLCNYDCTSCLTFIQKELDTTGLMYFGARYYDHTTGRFTSVDPFLGDIADPRSLHRYGYGFNNPFSFIDLFGLQNTRADILLTKLDKMSDTELEQYSKKVLPIGKFQSLKRWFDECCKSKTSGNCKQDLRDQLYQNILIETVTFQYAQPVKQEIKKDSQQLITLSPYQQSVQKSIQAVSKSKKDAIRFAEVQAQRAYQAGDTIIKIIPGTGQIVEGAEAYQRAGLKEAGKVALVAVGTGWAMYKLIHIGEVLFVQFKTAEDVTTVIKKTAGHHTIPQYMGGRKNQTLAHIADDIHSPYHEFLDNWKLPKGMKPRSPAPKSFGGEVRPWGRENKGLLIFAEESKENREFIVENIRESYKEYGIYDDIAAIFEHEAKIFINGLKK